MSDDGWYAPPNGPKPRPMKPLPDSAFQQPPTPDDTRERLARNMARRYYSTEEPLFLGSEYQFVEMHWPAFAEELDTILAEQAAIERERTT